MTATASEITHRDLCRVAASWMLGLGWCDLACWELGQVTPTAERDAATKRREAHHERLESVPYGEEHARLHNAFYAAEPKASVYDAVGLTIQALHAGRLGYREARVKRESAAAARRGIAPAKVPNVTLPRLQIIEVKRTRADLLGDLRAGKMLKYERLASHCVLAGSADAFGVKPHEAATPRILDDLASRGLPKHWGVARFYGSSLMMIRNPRRLATVITPEDRDAVVSRIARSMVYRVLGGGPMEESP